MINIFSNGSKVATINETIDGYGQEVFRVKVVQNYHDGIDSQERFISMKKFVKLASAKRWAKKEIK